MADMAMPPPEPQSVDGNASSAARAGAMPGTSHGVRDGKQRPGSTIEAKSPSNGKMFPTKIIRTLSSTYGSNPHAGGSEGRKDPTSGMDPLSQHIFERTHPENIVPPKPRAGTNVETESNGQEDVVSPAAPPRISTEPVGRVDSTGSMSKDKQKNRGSFFGRFIPSKKKDSQFDQQDVEDEIGDNRAEGTNAEMFSQPIGYIPKFPEPPKYIKVRARGKKDRDFDHVFLAQELRSRTGVEVAQAGGRRINPSEKMKRGEAIWAMEFSKDGRFLAAGGHDHVVRVWGVIATEEDRHAHENQEENVKDGARLSAPVFKSRPIQEYEGHTETVLALSWSKNNFLLSSSMDKTVRLYHTSRDECLCVFKHGDVVSSIQFHPRDDRFFLAGSLDSKLRLWSIPDKSVAFSAQLPDLITAVGFTPDGKTSIAGCFSGQCLFYETEGLRQLTQMHVRSAHGKNAKGSKITGIQTSDASGEVKLLITSNDSRIRLYNFRDKSLDLKFKGPENSTSQIRASFSDDNKYIISGSEDKKVYIWPTSGLADVPKDKRPVEMFEAHTVMVTAALIAPTRTRQLLQASGDPIYGICNPPPIQLVSRADSLSSNPPPEPEPYDVIPPTPRSTKPEETPAYLARCVHPGGNVIVTADFHGHIKVFRQDCAYKQRLRNNDSWDASSTFSKKVLHRSSSIVTRGSRHSMHDSLGPHHPSDRILSWRQSIDRSSVRSHDIFPLTPRTGGLRSPSPFKSFSTNPSSPAIVTARTASLTHPLSTSTTNTPTISAPTSFSMDSSTSPDDLKPALHPPPSAYASPATAKDMSLTPTLQSHARTPSADSNTTSSLASKAFHDTYQHPDDVPASSKASMLTEDSRARSASFADSRGAEDEDEESTGSEGERCKRCGGESFRAKKVGKGWGSAFGMQGFGVGLGMQATQERRLECTRCGMVV